MATFGSKSNKSPEKNRFPLSDYITKKHDFDSLTHFYFPFI